MNVIRILHIIGKMDRAGAETMLMNLYRNIDRNEIQFDFVTFTYEVGDYDAEITKLGGKIIPIVASNSIERTLKLHKFLRQNPEYKIVHAHTLLSNSFHLLAAKGAGVKHRISHSHNTSNGKSSIIKNIYEKWALITNNSLANHKIACGEQAAEYLFGTSKDVWILPNAVDIKKIMTVASRSRDYISQEFKDNDVKILQIGRLIEVKNHQFSIQVAEALKKRGIDFTIYFVGKGPLESSLKKQVREKQLEDSIIFLGLRTDIIELMASADYMIMPSFHEGFPVVLVESQTASLKSIISDNISKEVDLGLGLVSFLSTDSIEEWINKIMNLKKISIPRKEILRNLRVKGFDIETNATKLSIFYTKLFADSNM